MYVECVARDFVGVVFHVLLDGAKGFHNHWDCCCLSPHIRSTSISKSLYFLSFPVFLTEVLVSRGIVFSTRRQVLSFLFFSTMSGLLAVMVLSVWMGMSHRMVTLLLSLTVLCSFSYHLSFTSMPNSSHIFQCMWTADLLWQWVYSVLASSGKPETRWSMDPSKRPHSQHFGSTSVFLRTLCLYQRVGRLCSWAAMMKPSVSALRPAGFNHLACLGPRNLVSPAVGICCGVLWIPTLTWAVGDPDFWPWPLFWGHRWCSPHPLQVVL